MKCNHSQKRCNSKRKRVRNLVLLLLLNSISCSVARICRGGRLSTVYESSENLEGRKAFLIAGLQNQPDAAYQYIELTGYNRVNLEFSFFGYNPKNAGRQIENLVKDRDVVCGISVGAKAIEYCPSQLDCRVVLINPCSYPKVLRSRYYYLTRYLLPLAEVLSYGLGWVSVLPIIPADFGHHTSIALLVDQLFWIGWGDPDAMTENYGVIISTDDEFLEVQQMRDAYCGAEQIEIATRHGRTGTKSHNQAQLYNDAIDQLLQ